jgi:hypothetical protein
MSRTQLQRAYEIIFYRDLYARTHGRDQASTANIAAEYAKVRMAKGREAVTKSFIDTARTIHTRVLGMPSAEKLLLEMDNLPRQTNPFQLRAPHAVHCVQARELQGEHLVGSGAHTPHGLRI